MQYNFLSATVLLILITDPLGNIPIFINALRGVAAERRRIVILREIAIAFGILLLFMLVGDRFLARDEPHRPVAAARRRDRAVSDRAAG